jgi:hypothetical protein
MGLLDKTNPAATFHSVKREAITWAIISMFAYPVFCFAAPMLRESPLSIKLIVCPIFVLCGTAIGALMEWQLDDRDDDDPALPPSAAAKRRPE